MEHQSAVAYGNRYLGGYRGRAPSEVGLKFDFIIIHESAHEWWGNSVTAKDVADMWIHESFGAYAEALYVEHVWGYQEALRYINGKKPNVRNTEPIIGIYNVQHEGSGDMYDKGQLVLNTLRSVMDNDSLWFSVLKGLQERFRYQTITAEDVFGFVNQKTGKDYNYFFNQYFKSTKVPSARCPVDIQGRFDVRDIPLEHGCSGFPHARESDDGAEQVQIHLSDDNLAEDEFRQDEPRGLQGRRKQILCHSSSWLVLRGSEVAG